MYQIAVGHEQGGDDAVPGSGDIDNGLGGFHAEQQVIHLHGVTFFHVPLDHFRFLQTFAQIGQGEVGHVSLLGHSLACNTLDADTPETVSFRRSVAGGAITQQERVARSEFRKSKPCIWESQVFASRSSYLETGLSRRERRSYGGSVPCQPSLNTSTSPSPPPRYVPRSACNAAPWRSRAWGSHSQ